MVLRLRLRQRVLELRAERRQRRPAAGRRQAVRPAAPGLERDDPPPGRRGAAAQREAGDRDRRPRPKGGRLDCALPRRRAAGALDRHARPRHVASQVVQPRDPDRRGRRGRRDRTDHLRAHRATGGVVDGARRSGLRPPDQRALGDRHPDRAVLARHAGLAASALHAHPRRVRDRLARRLAVVLQPRPRLLGGTAPVPPARLPARPPAPDRSRPDGAASLYDAAAAVGDGGPDHRVGGRQNRLQRVLLERGGRRLRRRRRRRPHPRRPQPVRELPVQDAHPVRHPLRGRHLQRLRASERPLRDGHRAR